MALCICQVHVQAGAPGFSLLCLWCLTWKAPALQMYMMLTDTALMGGAQVNCRQLQHTHCRQLQYIHCRQERRADSEAHQGAGPAAGGGAAPGAAHRRSCTMDAAGWPTCSAAATCRSVSTWSPGGQAVRSPATCCSSCMLLQVQWNPGQGLTRG